MNKSENRTETAEIFSLIKNTHASNLNKYIKNEELVREVNSWWTTPESATNKSVEQLLNITEKEKGLGFGMNFSEIKQGEELLNATFRQISETNLVSVEIAILLLDSIYHTRLQNPLRISEKIQYLLEQENFLNKIKNAKKQQEIIDCVNKIAVIDKAENAKNNSIYSFATKFCNRINPDVFPIFDSYVAGLLFQYNEKDKYTEPFKKKSLGNYHQFFKVYNNFIKKYQLSNFNFKEIDIFMWTYGKILSSKNSNIQLESDIKLYVQFFMTDEDMQRLK